MNLNSRQKYFSPYANSRQKLSDQGSIPSDYLYPDLYLLMEFELQSPPSPSKSRLLYLVCIFASLTLVGLSFCNRLTQVQQAFNNFQNAVSDGYSALINH